MKVSFLYIAQLHQVLHSLPIAAELARRHTDIEVRVASPTEAPLAYARELLRRWAPDAPLGFDRLRMSPVDHLRLATRRASVPWKRLTLLCNRSYFGGLDAVVTPERTSLFLKHLRLPHTRLIWSRHGAGDRQVGFADDIRNFDFVMMAGRKLESRLLERGLIRAGHYATGVYAKFDWLPVRQEGAGSLFGNHRPTVLYNPHFRPELSSWPALGRQVLDYFAASTQYNLVFAPHVRLFDPPTPARYREFEAYRGLSHIHIDLGSVRSVDMSYTAAADIYLGDVSSQVVEFLYRPSRIPTIGKDSAGTSPMAWACSPASARRQPVPMRSPTFWLGTRAAERPTQAGSQGLAEAR